MDRLEYACLPSALYAAGMTAGAVAMSGPQMEGRPWAASVGLVTSIAWMAYLLDRAKPLKAWHDPADRMANPARDAWVVRRRPALNMSAAMLGLLACGLSLVIRPWLVVLVPLGAVSVMVYGARRSDSLRVRPKDVLVLKNALTGLAYATLIGWVLWAAAPAHDDLWKSLGMVALLVAGDALLSDIDDTPADATFGTRTVSVWAGRRWALAAGLGVHVLAVVFWLLMGSQWGMVFAMGMPISAAGIALAPAMRTAVDLRAGLLGGLALIWLLTH